MFITFSLTSFIGLCAPSTSCGAYGRKSDEAGQAKGDEHLDMYSI
jgi:hypothetical protein